jgi:hypothetical protein
MCSKFWLGNHKRRDNFGRTYESIIFKWIVEIGCKVNWIELSQEVIKWRDFVSTAINLRVS